MGSLICCSSLATFQGRIIGQMKSVQMRGQDTTQPRSCDRKESEQQPRTYPNHTTLLLSARCHAAPCCGSPRCCSVLPGCSHRPHLDCPFPLLFLLGAPSLHRGWHLPRLQLQLTPSQHLRLPQCGSASYDSAAPAFHFSTPTRQPCTLLYPHCTSHGSRYLSSAHLMRQHTATSWGSVFSKHLLKIKDLSACCFSLVLNPQCPSVTDTGNGCEAQHTELLHYPEGQPCVLLLSHLTSFLAWQHIKPAIKSPFFVRQDS